MGSICVSNPVAPRGRGATSSPHPALESAAGEEDAHSPSSLAGTRGLCSVSEHHESREHSRWRQKISLRVDRRGRDVCDAPRSRGGAGDTGGDDAAAGQRVSVEPVESLGDHLDQYFSLRVDRAVCGGAVSTFRIAPLHAGRDGAAQCGLRAFDAGDGVLAVCRAVGLRRGGRVGTGGHGARGGRREPVVHRAARARDGFADGEHRDGATRISTLDGGGRDRARLAGGAADRGGGDGGRDAADLVFYARRSARRRRASVWGIGQ